LLLFKGSLSSLSSFIGSFSIFVFLASLLLSFFLPEFFSLFCGDIDSRQPLIEFFMRRRVEKNSVFRYPSSALIEFITFFGYSQSDDISVVKTPVIVIDIFTVSDYKAAGAERYTTSSYGLLFGFYFIFSLNLCKADFNLPLETQNLHLEVTMF
jgi:hypothetical protein